MKPRSILLLSLLAVFATAPNDGAPAECQLHATGNQWEGHCGPMFDQSPAITIRAAKEITTGMWSKDVHPTTVWSGEMSDADYGKVPMEMEIYRKGSGIIRTIYGWYPVSNFDATSSAMKFEVDSMHEVPPNELDRQIVSRASKILSSTAVWNRSDNRKCPAEAKTWSIYCAMTLATIEVTGAFSHRRPALEVVRQIVDERTAGRPYKHRLMDYNNDPTTRLEDVQSLFAEALARMHH